jgi:hypothetical protein
MGSFDDPVDRHLCIDDETGVDMGMTKSRYPAFNQDWMSRPACSFSSTVG